MALVLGTLVLALWGYCWRSGAAADVRLLALLQVLRAAAVVGGVSQCHHSASSAGEGTLAAAEAAVLLPSPEGYSELLGV
jgi:hypothetical protein